MGKNWPLQSKLKAERSICCFLSVGLGPATEFDGEGDGELGELKHVSKAELVRHVKAAAKQLSGDVRRSRV